MDLFSERDSSQEGRDFMINGVDWESRPKGSGDNLSVVKWIMGKHHELAYFTLFDGEPRFFVCYNDIEFEFTSPPPLHNMDELMTWPSSHLWAQQQQQRRRAIGFPLNELVAVSFHCQRCCNHKYYYSFTTTLRDEWWSSRAQVWTVNVWWRPAGASNGWMDGLGVLGFVDVISWVNLPRWVPAPV